MDLERIKQNLRLRSGRSKKIRKQPLGQPTTGAQIARPDQKQIPNGVVHQPTSPTLQSVSRDIKSPPNENIRVQEKATPKSTPTEAVKPTKDRPNHPRATTETEIKSPAKVQPARFGRSGIERPQTYSAKASGLLRTMSETKQDPGARDEDSSSAVDFDLRPPPARPKTTSVEVLSEALFSSGHLNLLLRDPHYLTQFTSFLTRYRPQYHPTLLRYLETQKAIKAIEYANAVAEGVSAASNEEDNSTSPPQGYVAATLDQKFAESSEAAFRLMVNSALPMYITYRLVKLVTECLINEITGTQTPLMRDLVGGLSEVFCLSDPKQEDNPIIYASEEFFRYTGYGPDDVIGRNCRFLQGSKTKRESVSRLRDTISKGQATCETLLNYRRDGRPFINLLMIAPLHDDKGNVKYLLGAQVDVSGLVSRAKGLDGFERYMINREMKKREKEPNGNNTAEKEGFRKPRALQKLRELSEMFDLEESAVVRSHSRSASTSGDEDDRSIGSSRRGGRRVLGDSDALSDDEDNENVEEEDEDEKAWKLGQSGRSGLSGKLPGVYESYVLVRPAPSLRIIFVSPKLRRRFSGAVQKPFLSYVAASSNTMRGLRESFGSGEPVSAKINLLVEAGEGREGTVARAGTRLEDAGRGRICWISATPMVGSDSRVGVWIIVVVEKTKVPSTSNRQTLVRSEVNKVPQQPSQAPPRQKQQGKSSSSQPKVDSVSSPSQQRNQEADDIPIKPRRLEDVPAPNHHDQTPSITPEKGNGVDAGEVLGNDDHPRISVQDPSPVKEEVEDKADGATLCEEVHGAEDDPAKANPHLPISPKPAGVDGENGFDQEVEDHSEMEGVKDRARLESPEGDDMEVDLDGPHTPSDGDETVTNHQLRTPPSSRPGTSGKDSASTRNNSYMDYLRHPGSRPSDYNRSVSSTFLSGRYDIKEEEKEDGEDFQDPNCVRSPYSVD